MICWVYLVYCALRRWAARRAYWHCTQRSRLLHQQYLVIGIELLQALQAERLAEARLLRLVDAYQLQTGARRATRPTLSKRRSA